MKKDKKNIGFGRALTIALSLILINKGLKAQQGLEGIIVEKYYVSEAADTLKSLYFGKLPIGSTCYRVYADLAPGFRLQAVYGSPEHELRIETSTFFFNNWDIGNKSADVIPLRTLKRNTVMLDSWLSTGSAGEGVFGIPKEEDDEFETMVHEDGYLQGSNKEAGIPVKQRDGLKYGNNIPHTVFYGIEDSLKTFFKGGPPVFTTRNGAWACLQGAVGPDSLGSNKVLIAQLTTNGVLKFELNLQIGKKGETPQNYVARDPVEKEIVFPGLTFNSSELKPLSSGNKNSKNKK